MQSYFFFWLRLILAIANIDMKICKHVLQNQVHIPLALNVIVQIAFFYS